MRPLCVCPQALGGPGTCELLGLCLLSPRRAAHHSGLCGEFTEHVCSGHISCLSRPDFQLAPWSAASAQLAFLTHSPLRLLLALDITAAEPESRAFCSKSNQPLAVKLLVSVACTLLSCLGSVPAEPGVGRWKQFQVRISQIFPDLFNVLIMFPG